MKDEIKEILDMFTKYKDDWYSFEYKLKPKQCVAVLDYITRLEEENERLNNIINELEKYLKEIMESYGYENDITDRIEKIAVKNILNKLKKLKEGKE